MKLDDRSQQLHISTNPLVSVMITSYNQKDIILRAIQSVLDQTYKNIQIVIADDASTDGSQDLLRDISSKYPNQIKLILAQENQGIAKNKNMGFCACTGDFITYLDGDDYYFSEKIEHEIKVFNLNTNADIVYSNFAYADSRGEIREIWKNSSYIAPTGNIFKRVFSRRFPYKTLYRCELIRADVLKKVNYYDDSVIAYHDWDSRIRMSKNCKIAYSDYVGSAYVDDPRGISNVAKRRQLIDDMKYVINKNKNLLKKLSFVERYKILRDLEVIVTKQELSLQSSPFNLETFKYVILSGDLKTTARRLKRFLKLF